MQMQAFIKAVLLIMVIGVACAAIVAASTHTLSKGSAYQRAAKL